MGFDPVHDHLEERVEGLDDLPCGARGGEPGGADEVDEQHADVRGVAAEMGFLDLGGPRDLATHMADEQLAQTLTLADHLRHPVEPPLQLPEFGPVEHLHARVEVPAGEVLHGPADGVHRGEQGGHEQPGRGEPGREGPEAEDPDDGHEP